MNSGNADDDDNMQQQDHQGPTLPPIYGPPPMGMYITMMPAPMWLDYMVRTRYVCQIQQYELGTAAAMAAVVAAEAEARADAEAPLLPRLSPPNYVEVVEQELADPAAVYHPLVGSPPAEQPSPASSGSPEIVWVTPPALPAVPPMPQPLRWNRSVEPCVTRYSEPSTSRSTQSRKQQSSSRPTVRRSVKPYPQNLPRPRPVSTPLNYRMPPPAHSPAPLWTHSPKRHRTHSSMPLSAHSSITLPEPLNYRIAPPAHSPAPSRMHSPMPYRAHAPMRQWVHSPTLLPEHSPTPPLALSSVPLPTHSFVPPLPAYSPEPLPLLSSIPPPAQSPSIPLLNIPMPPPRHRKPTLVHPGRPLARPPRAVTAMGSAAPTPMSPTVPALHHFSYVPYSTAPSPVNRPTPAPARHVSAYVDLESPPQYNMPIHRGMHGLAPERMPQAPSASTAVNYPRVIQSTGQPRQRSNIWGQRKFFGCGEPKADK